MLPGLHCVLGGAWGSWVFWQGRGAAMGARSCAWRCDLPQFPSLPEEKVETGLGLCCVAVILWSFRSGCWASRCSWTLLGPEAAVERLVGPSCLLKLQAGDQQKQAECTAGEGGGLHEG